MGNDTHGRELARLPPRDRPDKDARGVKRPLLLYVSHVADLHRYAVAPALAAAAERAGYGFECYYDDVRAGRHFGGGDPARARPGWAAGSLVAGGRHADHVLWLATAYELVVLGDPDSILWPAVDAAGGELLARTTDPAELYAAAFARLGEELPDTVVVVDAGPQGRNGLVLAPYLYPRFLTGEPTLGVDVSCGEQTRETLAAARFVGVCVDPERASSFPGGLDDVEETVEADMDYAAATSALAECYADWGKGILLGDPGLVAAQLPKARRLRLLPLYGQPQTDVIERASELVEKACEPVYGRQYDDRDFLALSRVGHGLQVLDPDPPFDAEGVAAAPLPAPPQPLADTEPEDAELERWADEGRVLVTLLFWAGMIREAHCLPRLLDLVTSTGLRAGLVLTSESLRHAGSSALSLLSAPRERGGAFGLFEPLLGSTGLGVAAETLLPRDRLRESLERARREAADLLPTGLEPRGWWPLLDAPLQQQRASLVGRRGLRPVVRFTPRATDRHAASDAVSQQRELRGLAAAAVYRLGLERLFEERRPFDDRRPGAIDEHVAASVRRAGFSYMWSKTSFGSPRVLLQENGFVALSLTAGNWDGWSPFYTISSEVDLVRAERRLLRAKRPGWLASTVDSPLFALPGELLERGSTLFRIAELAARGGRSGKLVNVTPHVVARYARLAARRFA
jgi:hypothetical protein